MLPLRDRATAIAAAAQKNPILHRILEDIYERLDAAAEQSAPAPEPAKPARGGRSRKSGGTK